MNDAIQIENWCNHPANRAMFGAPPPLVTKRSGSTMEIVQPQPTVPLVRSTSTYVVPENATEATKQRIVKAERFAESQRQMITASQQQADLEDDEHLRQSDLRRAAAGHQR